MSLAIKSKANCRWDLVSLGEVMLRLDPGDDRIHTARSFRAWEGGGEYNVARGLKRCFGLETAVVTALAENPVGRLVEDLMRQGGVDQSHVNWVTYDGVGRSFAQNVATVGSIGLKTRFSIGNGSYSIDGLNNTPRAPRIGANGWPSQGVVLPV